MRPFYAITQGRGVLSMHGSKLHKLTVRFLSLFILLFFSSAGFSQDVTIFQPADGPTTQKFNDGLALETGMKFRSSQAGYIKGLRYYKSAGTTGVHTAHLWTSAGVKIAEAVFSNETPSGWQQVMFGSPVAITANTTYIASYHSASGDYAATNPFFTQAFTNGPLRALANAEDGPNGVYVYTSSFSFPNNPSGSANYWVDVIFNTSNAADETAPQVSFVSPLAGEADVDYNRSVSASFNEPIDPATVTASSFQLRDAANTIVPASVISMGNQLLLDPATAYTHNTVYTATIRGGAAGVKDIAGNALASDYSWSFTVADLPPSEGTGGPILVLSSVSNPFSRYATEILKAQGLNEFSAKDILQVNAADLSNYDVIILGEMTVTAAQTAMLTSWVNAGGTLVSFRPSAELAPLLGITRFTGAVSEGYILVNTATPAGAGIVGETMQFHGTADLYTLNDAVSIATLYTNATTATDYPAVTIRTVGSNGGKAIAFTYDLARSIVYTRQGNPAWSGQKRDGTVGPIRSDDMFFGVNEPHWVDFNKIAIPQADEQQHLLTNLILQSNLHKKPLPKFWFLPSGHKAAIVMTGDDHSFNGTTGQFNHFKTLGPNTPEDVANWKAIRATSYIYNGTMTNAQAAGFAAEGFEIALHLNTNCQNFTAASLQDNISQQMALFNGQLPNVPRSITNRNHCIAWSDWATGAKVQAGNGIRLDANYYYWPASWVQNRPGMFTGSGLPMRFADLDGSLIDCYQLTTQMTDEAEIDYAPFSAALMNKALGPEGYYGVFCANMHTDKPEHLGANAIIAEAVARNVPVISARQMLEWLDGRNGSSFGPLTWNNNQLSFSITVIAGALNLQTMLPVNAESGQLVSITRDGANVPFTQQTIKGLAYAFFNVPIGTGSYIATYSSPDVSPVVTLHPLPQEVCIGSTVQFTSNATGAPAPTVQWEVWKNGVWKPIAGATNDTLSFVATVECNKTLYRAIWTNAQGVAVSDSALLVVQALPVLTSSLTATVASGTLFTYTPTSNQATTVFTWTREQVAGINNPPASGTGSVSEVLVNSTNDAVYVKYNYTLTAKGCTNTQTVVVMVKPAVVDDESCIVTSAIAANFNSTGIRAGRYIWFSSVFDPANLGNGPVTFNVTNSKITFTANNVDYTLGVPNSTIQFSNTISSPSTQFGGNGWKSMVPLNTTGNVFLTGISYQVPVNLPGGIRNVRWTADISKDKPGVTLNWKWAAAVYTSFSSNAGISVKTVDGPIQLINTNLTDKAGTPLNYKLFVTPGATGGGILGGLLTVTLFNYTGDYSSTAAVSCQALVQGRSANEEVELAKTGVPATMVPGNTEVRALPNPSAASFQLLIHGSSTSPVAVRVFDVLGRVVENHQNVSTTTMQIGDRWKSGTYLVEVIKRDGERKVIKLIKL